MSFQLSLIITVRPIFVILSLLIGVYSESTLASSEACIQFYKQTSIVKSHYGLTPEFQNTQILLLSYMGTGKYFINMHRLIAENLPKGIKAFAVIPSAAKADNQKAFDHSNFYKDQMKDLIEKGQLSLIEIPVDGSFSVSEHPNWIRDFMSNTALTKDGKVKFLNAAYFNPTADYTEKIIQEKVAVEIGKLTGRGVENMELPFKFEWGNWENDGLGNIFVSKVFLKSNRDLSQFVNMDYGEIKREFELWFRTHVNSSLKVHWIKQLPTEPTGHVDLMFKFVDANTVVLAKSPNIYEQAELLKAKKQLENLGKTVHTIDVAVADVERELGRNPFTPFRSYTNSLILNSPGQAQSIVYVPKYANEQYPELESYDKAAKKMYESLGFKTIMVDSGDAIDDQGAVHCATCTIPIYNKK
ncbi:MAG: agmatine deiminase family protein [Bdellovibrionaceae bacterium]|nr:agmatine deiminase family protein [Pseudobdellovibrionaceae bacterium]